MSKIMKAVGAFWSTLLSNGPSSPEKCEETAKVSVPPPNFQGDESPGSKFWDGFDEQGKFGTYINTHHPVFQQGRYLYDAQVLYADAERWKSGHSDYQKSAVTPERVILICKRNCQLINALGQLRADYEVLKEIVEGKRKRTERGDYYTS